MKHFDLGILSTQRAAPLVLGAPSRVTRAVWLLGVVGCLIFLWSVATTLGWVVPSGVGLGVGRYPSLFETVFWLPAVLLAGLSLGMSLGGVKLLFTEEGLELRSLWPSKGQRHFRWTELSYARFWEEPSRSREQLFAVRFVFATSEVTCKVPNEKVWLALREQFTA